MSKERIEGALPEGLKAERMPKHVAVIMDGNRRWAKERGMVAGEGHREAKRVVLEITSLSSKWGIKVLSLFAFSTENWSRPIDELEDLMNLFQEVADGFDDEYFQRYDVRVTFIGDRSSSSKLPECMVEKMKLREEETKARKGLHLILALNYSGRQDIIEATKSIAGKVKDGKLQIEDINERLIGGELQTNCIDEFPMPDLLIRTSGEQRISNYMLWQLAYTELYFPEKKFPDFGEEDYVEALISYQKRDRRFGGKNY